MSDDAVFEDPAYLQLEYGLPEDVAYVHSILQWDPTLFFTDPAFFLHAVTTLARGETDFEVLPVPNSVELVIALSKVKPLLDKYEFSDSVKRLVKALLDEDGIQYPHPPFVFLDPKEFTIQDSTLSENQKKAFHAIFSQPALHTAS
jgi:hypothetical protein